MIIDVRCRPPLEEFREYFDIPRITWHGARTGAMSVSRAFVEGSMELYFDEMEEAGIDIAVVQGRNSPEVFMGKKFNAAFIRNERIAELQDKYPGRFIGLAAHRSVESTLRRPRRDAIPGPQDPARPRRISVRAGGARRRVQARERLRFTRYVHLRAGRESVCRGR
jgi:hypothetical protein